MHWLDLFSLFDMAIHHVPGKSNIVTDALLAFPNLDAVFGSVESSLLTKISEVQAAAYGGSWEQLNKVGSACECVLYSVMVCYAIHGV